MRMSRFDLGQTLTATIATNPSARLLATLLHRFLDFCKTLNHLNAHLLIIATLLFSQVASLTAVARSPFLASGAINGRVFETLGVVNTYNLGWNLYRVVNKSEYSTTLMSNDKGHLLPPSIST